MCERDRERETATQFEVTGCFNTRTESLVFILKIWYVPESQNCMVHRCRNFPGQGQLQTALQELFHPNDFDMEASIVCKQWIHDGHTEIVFMTTIVKEFTEKVCQTADYATSHHYKAKSQALYIKMLKKSFCQN
jgi:hypothetical protein